MKKILFILFCVCFVTSYAQNSTGIYHNNEKLGYSRIIGKNVGNIAGAYFTLGLSSAKSNKVIEGETAELKIQEKKPSFIIKFGEKDDTGYIFSKPSNMENLVIIKLYDKKKARNLNTGKYGLTGVKTGVNEEDMQALKIEKIDDNSFKVTPREELEKGEYAFYYIGDVPEGKDSFNGVFDFSITKK